MNGFIDCLDHNYANQRGEPVNGERNNRHVPETLLGQNIAMTHPCVRRT